MELYCWWIAYKKEFGLKKENIWPKANYLVFIIFHFIHFLLQNIFDCSISKHALVLFGKYLNPPFTSTYLGIFELYTLFYVPWYISLHILHILHFRYLKFLLNGRLLTSFFGSRWFSPRIFLVTYTLSNSYILPLSRFDLKYLVSYLSIFQIKFQLYNDGPNYYVNFEFLFKAFVRTYVRILSYTCYKIFLSTQGTSISSHQRILRIRLYYFTIEDSFLRMIFRNILHILLFYILSLPSLHYWNFLRPMISSQFRTYLRTTRFLNLPTLSWDSGRKYLSF